VPQSGPQAYGDAEAEALTEEIALEIGQAPNAITAEHPTEQATPENRPYQILTIVGLIALAVFTLVFKLDIGFVAITIGLVLSLMAPNLQKRAMGQVTWPEIMLITGVSTYVEVMEKWARLPSSGTAWRALLRR
jgi:hypothetical protein